MGHAARAPLTKTTVKGKGVFLSSRSATPAASKYSRSPHPHRIADFVIVNGVGLTGSGLQGH